MAGAASACLTTPALASVPTPFTRDLWPDMGGREAFVAWMKAHRGEDANFLGQRWDRYLQLIGHADVWDAADKRAFLMTPREEFVTAENLSRAYEWHHLNIGFGVTITGPHTTVRSHADTPAGHMPALGQHPRPRLPGQQCKPADCGRGRA